MRKEIWKNIEGFEQYSVSNLGKVRNNKTGRVLRQSKINTGYFKVILSKNGIAKNLLVHRLVGFAFVPGYFEGAEIDHINRVRTDNAVDNLRWVTRQENVYNILDGSGKRYDLSAIMKLKHKDVIYKENLLAANHKRKENTYKKLDEMYDENLSVAQNLRNINKNGFSVCRATIYNWINDNKISA